ncbi:unnamed protein product [Urochloa humidicola]
MATTPAQLKNVTAEQEAAAARETAANATLQHHPELVMAARRGDVNKLKELLLLNDDDAVVEIDNRPAAASHAVVEFDRRPAAAAAAAAASASGVTMEGDSLLHIVAASADSEEFRECAKLLICGKKQKKESRGLLSACNHKGDTPLHCAAGSGNTNMVSCLVDLAVATDAGDDNDVDTVPAVTKLLRMRNKRGETAMCQAVRAASMDSVKLLMSVDSELACIPRKGEKGASPFYLAISSGQIDIARHLFDVTKGKLSYSGPYGRNVLHEAVSRRKVLSTLLEWFEDAQELAGNHEVAIDYKLVLSQLALEGDEQQDGSTPLHLLVTSEPECWEVLPTVTLYPRFFFPDVWPHRESLAMVLSANTCAAYQPDNQGLYPIHVAAIVGSLVVVKELLKRCPDCSTLRDGKQGATFLHFAVDNKRYRVVEFACQTSVLSSILNLQDNNGDTALHRAVRAGHLDVFNCLVRNSRVRLDVSNSEGMTPLDLSWISHMHLPRIPALFSYTLNPRMVIRLSLEIVGAPHGGSRADLFRSHIPKREEAKEAESLTNATQVMSIVSVLIATVTFASAFTLPGGYRSADDDAAAAAANHGPLLAGTPLLAAKSNYAFHSFVLADTLAFICSCLATFKIVYAGLPGTDLSIRVHYLDIAGILLRGSERSLIAAFALGLYVVLAPVAHMIAVAVCVISFAPLLLFDIWEAPHTIGIAKTACARLGSFALPTVMGLTSTVGLSFVVPFWSFAIIFGHPAIWIWVKHG